MATYKIIRFFQDPNKNNQTIERGLSLEEAQAHCKDPETSSRTCTTPIAKLRTKKYGPWFEGYTEDK